MLKFNFRTIQKEILGDSVTPIELYLKFRTIYPNILLYEISHYKYNNNERLSIICINPLSELILDQKILKISYPNNIHKHIFISDKFKIRNLIDSFFKKFISSDNLNFLYSGFYGYLSYDSVQYFEKINFYKVVKNHDKIPKIRLGFYKNLIIFHHFYNKINLIEHKFDNIDDKKSSIDKILELIKKKIFFSFSFKKISNHKSNVTNKEYQNMVSKGIDYCLKGDVFQIVLSRQFIQKFKGDEFNIYRALRFINPSPYLFYFDYGNYKIFGSSPESQLIIYKNVAYINPIAGTIKRSKNSHDQKIYKDLINNPKENSEHIMLVDLARNDLSKNSIKVKVEMFKNVQYFSHVLHMVSRVSGKIDRKTSMIKIFGDTFPSGTLSGAPKYKAMELIDQIENQNRGIYGGAIGFFGINNSFVNTAIIIRSFLSKNNTLFFQAGAGIVSNSNEKNELEEVNNKLMALFQSIDLAEKI